jgi:hypothetical protein
VRRIVADGHAIANHSWSHPRLTDLSSAAIVDQLVATSDVIEAASGVRPTCYRPPYGATDARVHAAAVGAGLPNADWTTGSSGSPWGLWDIDTNDWRLSQPGSGWSEAAMRRELDKVGDGDTVLMHDGSSPRPRGLAVLEQWLAGNHDRFEFRALPGCGGQLVEPALDPAQPQRWHRFQIARLYRAYFDRAPDAAGWEYWSRVYSQGHPLTAISDLFATSSELGLRGEMTDDELVVFVYRHVLDRAPDEGGRRYWLGELERGLTRGELIVWFSESDEYVARTVEVMAGDCYDGTVAGSYRCWAGTLPSYDW